MKVFDKYTCQCALTDTTAACDASTIRIADGTNRPRPANPTNPGKLLYYNDNYNITITERSFVVDFLQTSAGRDQLIAKRVRELGG